MSAIPIVALSLCLFLSCGTDGRDASVGGDWRAEIDSVLNMQVGAWNRGDVAGFMDGYWKSDSLLFTSGGNVRRGWRETFEKYSASYNTREKI